MCPFCPTEHTHIMCIFDGPGAFPSAPNTYQNPDHLSRLTLRSSLCKSLSAFSPAFLNFCSQIIDTVSRVIGLMWVGFLSAALLWQFWTECSPVHIYRPPRARPEQPWKAHSSFCLSLVTRMCDCHGVAPDSGPFLPVSLHMQSCCWTCSLPPACPGWSWTIWCSLFQTTVLSLFSRLMRIFQCMLISALPSHLAHIVSSALFDT